MNNKNYFKDNIYHQDFEQLGEIKSKELFEQYKKTKNKEIRDRLVEANIPLAKKCTTNFVKGYETKDYEDLFQVALLALLIAVENFDIESGNMFSTYATSCINGQLNGYLQNNSKSAYIPHHLRPLIKKIKELQKEAEKQEKILTIKDLANILEIKEEIVFQLINAKNSSVSMSGSGEDDEISLHSVLPDPNSQRHEKELENKMYVEQILNDAISLGLTEKELLIIEYRLGLKDGMCHSPKAIAKQLKTTASTVERIYAKGLKKLIRSRNK